MKRLLITLLILNISTASVTAFACKSAKQCENAGGTCQVESTNSCGGKCVGGTGVTNCDPDET